VVRRLAVKAVVVKGLPLDTVATVVDKTPHRVRAWIDHWAQHGRVVTSHELGHTPFGRPASVTWRVPPGAGHTSHQ